MRKMASATVEATVVGRPRPGVETKAKEGGRQAEIQSYMNGRGTNHGDL
jgi:hypothetical protein